MQSFGAFSQQKVEKGSHSEQDQRKPSIVFFVASMLQRAQGMIGKSFLARGKIIPCVVNLPCACKSFHVQPNMLRLCIANKCGVHSENESISIPVFKENTKGK